MTSTPAPPPDLAPTIGDAQLADLLADVHGAFADGYTSEDASAVLARLSAGFGITFVVLWDYEDMWGTGGDSDIFARDGKRLRHVSSALWHHLNGEEGSHALEAHGREAGWGPALLSGFLELTPNRVAALHGVDEHNVAYKSIAGEA